MAKQAPRLARDLETLFRMAEAYAKGSYHAVPGAAVGALAAGLLYLVNPFDVAADFLPLVGLLDDAAVLALLAAGIRYELERFLRWEAVKK